MKEASVQGMVEVMRRHEAQLLKTLPQKVAPQHTAVLVIDVQNDACHSDGIHAKRGQDPAFAQRMVPRLVSFLSGARQYRPLFVFVRMAQTEWSLSPVSLERRLHYPEELRFAPREGTWGADFYQVSPQDGDCIVTKHRSSAFQGTDLDLVLRRRGIRTVVVTGVVTSACVESTVREASMRDFYVVVVRDCVAAHSREEHEASLSVMEKYFASLATSAEVLAAWRQTGVA